ncbi:hypothetical protein N7457_005327 [Penicillium paradoxum]|uniref:uncharacterized protein n=1 Tax=Penicillium paradoxum TaxID=176176 RepID=UPI0025484FC8|nr:uncharacterized protein N7457_005327 [Penicillium paradoxum]KAJ5780167.1 hypothetical protein N7457_005327 [Penicillium paradoxum]
MDPEVPLAQDPGRSSQPPKPRVDEYTNASRGRGIRFKSSSSRHSKVHKDDSSHRHRKRSHHHRPRTSDNNNGHSKRRCHDDTENDAPEHSNISTADAFRESLFDALGDDEGAQYWEHVYGQPIHNYRVPEVQKGPDGELEQMTEEEYVSYVRARMWERTREGMMEAQERLRAERMQKKKEEARGRAEDERRAFERAMDESLRRGAERKRAKRPEWSGAWAKYLERWETIGKIGSGDTENGSAAESLRSLIFWPVHSGKRADIQPKAVEEFMRHAPAPAEFLGMLKTERIRWHPDKIQHRYGALGIDDDVMRSVTEVFQIVDRLWNEEKERRT